MASFLERVINRLAGISNNPGSVVVPTRALDATFTPSTTNYTLCAYTVQMVITTGQTSTVVMNSDSAAPPTVARASATNNVIGTLRQQLLYIVPPNENVRLVSSGTGAATIVQQFEIPLS